MMFERLKRMLGLRSADAPSSEVTPRPPTPFHAESGPPFAVEREQPFAIIPTLQTVAGLKQALRPSPARGLLVRVDLRSDRTRPGSMTLLGSDGVSQSDRRWTFVSKADGNLAASKGNPSLDPRLKFGETPTGTYKLTDVLPARTDADGIALFGPNRVLRLRPLTGQAAEADSNGRTAILVHGGANPLRPTDGSLRLSDQGMTDLLAALSVNADGAHPPVTFCMIDIDQAASQAQVPSSGMRSPSYGRRINDAPIRMTHPIGSHSSVDDYPDWYFYNQMYLYDTVLQDRRDDGYGSDPYAYLGTPSDMSPSAVPDQGSTDAGSGDVTWATADTASIDPTVGNDFSTAVHSDPVYVDGSGGSSDWSPDGGAYGR